MTSVRSRIKQGRNPHAFADTIAVARAITHMFVA
jgi:hypothetical protein